MYFISEPTRMGCIFWWSSCVAMRAWVQSPGLQKELGFKQSKSQDKMHASILIEHEFGVVFCHIYPRVPYVYSLLSANLGRATLIFLMLVSCKSIRCTFPSFLEVSFDVFASGVWDMCPAQSPPGGPQCLCQVFLWHKLHSHRTSIRRERFCLYFLRWDLAT